jgi:hypothetical protein
MKKYTLQLFQYFIYNVLLILWFLNIGEADIDAILIETGLFRKSLKVSNCSPSMRSIQLNAVLKPRIGLYSLSISPISIQYHRFHTASVLRLPNPYSKRPTEFPQPAEKPPRPPATHPNHGLYGFFRDKKSLTPPGTLGNHGNIFSGL